MCHGHDERLEHLLVALLNHVDTYDGAHWQAQEEKSADEPQLVEELQSNLVDATLDFIMHLQLLAVR